MFSLGLTTFIFVESELLKPIQTSDSEAEQKIDQMNRILFKMGLRFFS